VRFREAGLSEHGTVCLSLLLWIEQTRFALFVGYSVSHGQRFICIDKWSHRPSFRWPFLSLYATLPMRGRRSDNHPYRFHLYRYDPEEGKQRLIVERTNAWFKSFRRLRNRFDYHIASFESLLYLAIIIICVRRLVL
jgi:hypothetical protein